MTVPPTMSFVDMTTTGDPNVLRLGIGPVPTPKAGEVLVRVHAAGVNRPDIQQRRGLYPPPPGASPILGLEVAGEVVAVGDGVRWPVMGEAICALANGGGYAEYCVVPAGQCLPMPRGLDAVGAAALPETAFTVWANLFEIGGLRVGETILIHGGSSGIGVMAIKLAKAFGATVYATAGSAEKCDACRQFGADATINYRTTDFEAEIQTLTSGNGVDVVLDMVGADYAAQNVRSLKTRGRLVIIGFMGGRVADGIDLTRIVSRRLTITGSTMRPRTTDDKAALAGALRAKVWPLLEDGRCLPEIHRVFPMAQAAAAHQLMEDSSHIGKIVLKVEGAA